jgi:tripartite-type tricarboxylate transporter receptor subunit TctC
VLAPGRTPLEVIDKLHADIVSVLQLPETRSRITGLGGEPVGNTPREFVALLHEELGKWAKVIKDANIKID